jgi:signal transduction histidine kinase
LSALASRFRGTAAWRLSIPATLAFAAGTGAAFLIAYTVVAGGIGERNDAWLMGESELLAQVARGAPAGDLHDKMVEEVAELARHEILPAPGNGGRSEAQPVFFLLTSADGEAEVWVGPEARAEVVAALRRVQPRTSDLFTIDVPGWDHPFRVAAHDGKDGGMVYLGLIDLNSQALLHGVQRTFLWLWSGMLIFGSLVAILGAHRILRRVEQVTGTAARIGEENLRDRVPEEGGHDEIARLATTFNQMLSRIEVSVKQIRSVTDAVAHDLRSPVTAVRGNLELALTGTGDGDLRGSVARALDDLDRLQRILDTSLDVAEAEAGALRLNRQTVDIGTVLVEMEEIYRPVAEERGLGLEVTAGEPVAVSIDVDLVRRAIANLLDNAMEHLPRGRRVVMSAVASGEGATLAVADDGPGFPPDIAQRAFERFVKGHQSRGYGLGLALVRAAARAHGGEARILENPGGGALVTLLFPAR